MIERALNLFLGSGAHANLPIPGDYEFIPPQRASARVRVRSLDAFRSREHNQLPRLFK